MSLRWLTNTLVLLSGIGLVDAAYLAAEHYRGAEVVCQIGTLTIGNCGSVLASSYATIWSIPIATIGAAYYFLALVFAALLVAAALSRVAQALAVLTGAGFVASVYFVYLQLFVLEAICAYCMVSALSTTLLFVLSVWLTRRLTSPEVL